MSNKKFSPEELLEFSKEIFNSIGLKETDAEAISKILVETDKRGIGSHGIARAPIYAKRLKMGLINQNPKMEVKRESKTTALLDADNGMGQLAAEKAMKLCIEKGKEYGLGAVAVKSSNHFGINAYYSMMAAKEDLIGMAFTNTSPLMVPFGGKKQMLGTNPLSIAIPAGDEPDVVLDMATTLVARGKLELALNKGEEIPDDWAVDSEGMRTTDPKKALEGALLPFAGPKGYGMSLIVDILSGVLTGSNYGPYVGSLFGDMDRPQNLGHFFLTINVDNFEDVEEFKKRVDKTIKELRESPKAKGFDRIFMPGEIEYEKSLRLKEEGIELNDAVIDKLNDLAKELNLSNRL